MIACKPDDVKVVAIVIANTIPDAFAGFGTINNAMQFDFDRDFSDLERQSFLALAGRIVDALEEAHVSAALAPAIKAFA
jgi:hypothetical protein